MALAGGDGKVSLVDNLGGWNAIGNAADKLYSLLPPPNEYKGDKGNITLSIDKGTQVITNIMQKVPVLKKFAGIAKVGNLVGGVARKLGGGTDAMNTTDAIMGSTLMLASGIGYLNGALGSRTDTIDRDEEAFNTVGGSYNGTSIGVDDALHYSGKKYGALSFGSKGRANDFIHKMGLQLTTMADIANDTTMNNNLLANQSAIAGYSAGFELGGGYDMATTRAAKYGMKFTLDDINRVKNIINKPSLNIKTHKKGGELTMNIINKSFPKEVNRVIRLAKAGTKTIKPKKSFVANFDRNTYGYPEEIAKDEDFLNFIDSMTGIAENLLIYSPDYDMYKVWKLNSKPKTFKEALNNGMFSLLDDGYHATSTYKDPESEIWYWAKSPNHPTSWMEEAWYNGNTILPKPLIYYDKEALESYNPEAKENYDIIPMQEGTTAFEDWKNFHNRYKLVKPTDGSFWRYEPRYPGSTFTEEELDSLLLPWKNLGDTIIIDGKTYEDAGTDEKGHRYKDEKGDYYYFKEGGLMNLIPEGALHKNKHHMENDENITKKGIPVVIEESNGELNLLAEIECNEIIFNLEVTKKLEELNKIYLSENSTLNEKDRVAIEAGKLLTEEILNNTDDRTGLIQTIN